MKNKQTDIIYYNAQAPNCCWSRNTEPAIIIIIAILLLLLLQLYDKTNTQNRIDIDVFFFLDTDFGSITSITYE